MEAVGEKDPFSRFVQAQDPVYAQVCAELAAGKKVNHWMWFIFPQLLRLGSSAMAIRFALASRKEAVDFGSTRSWDRA